MILMILTISDAGKERTDTARHGTTQTLHDSTDFPA